MSHEMLNTARELKLKGPGKAIILTLADRANESGTCWPSINTIAEESGLGRSTVKKHLGLLRDAGLISWEHSFTSEGDKGSNRYLLSLGGGSRGGLGGSRGGLPSPPDGPQVVHEVAHGGSRGGHKASIEAPEGSTKEASLFGDGDVSENPKPSIDALAESIYREYPRKVSKKPALKAIKIALKKNTGPFLLEKTKTFAEKITWKESQFIPHPATWFGQERFNDDPADWEEPPANPLPKAAMKNELHSSNIGI